MLVTCPFCLTSWDEEDYKPNQRNSYQCLQCGTTWTEEQAYYRPAQISATTPDEWEALEENDRIVRKW